MTYRLVEYYAGERAGWSHFLSFLTTGLKKQNRSSVPVLAALVIEP
jgi:hypothetical protein